MMNSRACRSHESDRSYLHFLLSNIINIIKRALNAALKPLMGHVTRPIKSSTYYQQPPMELDDVRDALAALCLSVGEVELEGDAKVAADDDGRRHGEVEGEHGDDKREALVFHLPPGE